MGSKNKLKRFNENDSFNNVFQPKRGELVDQTYPLKGHWNQEFFKNSNPLVLELGCGKGEYTIGLAERYPDKNFIGIDIKGARFWRGAKTAVEKQLPNVAFIRAQIELVESLFASNEIDEIWITFPDPFPRDGDEKRRLTSPKFLEMYKQLVKAGGLIHFKTDNTGLYEYTELVLSVRPDCQIRNNTSDFYESELRDAHYGIKTRYEKIFSDKGEKIKYIQFSFIE